MTLTAHSADEARRPSQPRLRPCLAEGGRVLDGERDQNAPSVLVTSAAKSSIRTDAEDAFSQSFKAMKQDGTLANVATYVTQEQAAGAAAALPTPRVALTAKALGAID